MYTLFWIFLIIIVYSYVVYPFLLFVLSVLIRPFKKGTTSNFIYPDVTLFIAAYNEIDFVNKKVANSFDLDYPKEKIHQVWVTDGSNDGTQEAVSKYQNIKVYHIDERNGKIGAINRGMQFVKTPIVIFSDSARPTYKARPPPRPPGRYHAYRHGCANRAPPPARNPAGLQGSP